MFQSFFKKLFNETAKNKLFEYEVQQHSNYENKAKPRAIKITFRKYLPYKKQHTTNIIQI